MNASYPINFLPILPEILILALGILVLLVDMLTRRNGEQDPRRLGWLTAGGLLVILVIGLVSAPYGHPTSVLGGMVRYDWISFLFKAFFLFAAAITAMLMIGVEKLNNRAEAYLLLLAATLGMSLMASAADLVMLYLAIETTSIPLYVLAGFMLSDERSTEAGFKYLLFGAFTSAILLYGLSLLFGFTGTTDLYQLAALFTTGALPLATALGVLGLIAVGLAFKVSVVPFHFWAPDVYQGAPTPVAGFLSTASKAAGFAVLLRLFLVALPDLTGSWTLLLAIISTITMTLGNLLAIGQTDIKRLLAYSSIAHAGYALIGVVAANELGTASVVFYLVAYILTNLAAFGIVTAFGRQAGSDEISAYAGLSRRSPGLALAMLVAFLSLAGMPPFAGFVGKVFVFAAAVQTGWVWLAAVGVLNSIVGLYYYLNVLKVVYLFRMEGEQEEQHPVPLLRPHSVALVVLSAGILLLGTLFAPWFNSASQAAISLF